MPKDVAIIDTNNSKEFEMLVKYVKSKRNSGKHYFDMRKCRNQRSLSANSYYWAVVLPAVARGLLNAWGETLTVDECHVWLKTKFLFKPVVNRQTGEAMGRCPKSSASLDTVEFAEYLDNVIKFAGEQLGEVVPAPTHDRAMAGGAA